MQKHPWQILGSKKTKNSNSIDRSSNTDTASVLHRNSFNEHDHINIVTNIYKKISKAKLTSKIYTKKCTKTSSFVLSQFKGVQNVRDHT